MSNLQELQAQRKELDTQIESVQKENRAGAIKEIKSLMENFNITVEDLVKTGKSKSASVAKVAPKWKHTPTGATWTGRGKSPKWFTEDNTNVVSLVAETPANTQDQAEA